MVVSLQWIRGEIWSSKWCMSVPKPCCSACNATGRHQCMQSSGGLQIKWRVSAVFPVWPALTEDWTDWEGGEEASLQLRYTQICVNTAAAAEEEAPSSSAEQPPPAAGITNSGEWNLLQASTRCWAANHCRGRDLRAPRNTLQHQVVVFVVVFAGVVAFLTFLNLLSCAVSCCVFLCRSLLRKSNNQPIRTDKWHSIS